MSNQLATKGFDLAVTSFDEAENLARRISNSALAPQSYRGKVDDTLVAMMMGNELGLNPIQAIQNIAVINGKPSIYGDAMLALVQNHPKFGGINETYDDTTKTALCEIWRKGGEKHVQTYSKSDAERAGLWGRKGPWTQYPQRMLAMRARGFALRNQFADALCGLISAKEAHDLPVERDIPPAHESIQHQTYLTAEQSQELESLAAPVDGLIDKIKAAYNVTTLTDLPVDKFDECKSRIAKFMGKINENN